MITAAIVLDGDGSIQVDDVLPGGSTADNIFRILPYDIWNLDFFRPYLKKFCISGTISTLQLLAIGYVTAVFPLLLVIIAFILAWLDKRGGNPVSCLLRPIKNC